MKYIHLNGRDNYIKGTIALVPPTKASLTSLFLQHATQLMVQIGATLLHPNDNFKKSTGREKATERMAAHPANFMHLEIKGTQHVFNFHVAMPCPRTKDDKEVLDVYFSVSTTFESEHVKILCGELA